MTDLATIRARAHQVAEHAAAHLAITDAMRAKGQVLRDTPEETDQAWLEYIEAAHLRWLEAYLRAYVHEMAKHYAFERCHGNEREARKVLRSSEVKAEIESKVDRMMERCYA